MLPKLIYLIGWGTIIVVAWVLLDVLVLVVGWWIARFRRRQLRYPPMYR